MNRGRETLSPKLPIRTAFFHIMGGNFSGAAKNIFRLLRRLDANTVTPILFGQAENELTRRAREIGIDVRIVPYPPALDRYDQSLLTLSPGEYVKTIRGVWQYNRSLIRHFKDIKPDVVWADNIRTFVFIYAACKLSGCKVIWNCWSEPTGKAAWVLNRVGLIFSDVVNTEYKSQAPKVVGRMAHWPVFRDKIVTLYTGVTDFEELAGVNIRGELGLTSSDILVLMAGNITPGKGQLDLLKAMSRVVKAAPHVHLLLAGRPIETHPQSMLYDASLQRYVGEHGLSRNVHFLGWRSDVPDLLQAADIYVSSSYSESLPDAIRDAMRAGKPMVVSNVGGTNELVQNNRCGFLFEAGDVDALAGNLSRLIEDSELRAAQGAEGIRIIEEEFSTALYARNFEAMVLGLYH